MRITAQEEYGLRCILTIASRTDDTPVSIQDIASAEGLSKQYVAKLLHQLQQAGLITSCRGIHGGYRLAKPAAQTSVGCVINALGGLLTNRTHKSKAVCDTFVGNQSRCVHEANCGIRPLWTIIAQQIAGVLDRLMLTDLLTGESTSTAVISEYFNKEQSNGNTTVSNQRPACECRGQTDSQGCVAHRQCG